MKKRMKHSTVIKIVVLAAVCLLAVTAAGSWFLFRVTGITYEGSRHYNDEELNQYIFGSSSPNALFYTLFGKKDKQIPFVQKYDVEVEWPNKMNVIVYEKAIVGYINYMGCNMYFDKDGIVVESSSAEYSQVPEIEGLKFTSIVLGSKLEVGNDSIFTDILDMTQAFDKYGIDIDKIYFDSQYNVTLYMGNVKVLLGEADDSTDKLYALKRMQDKIADLSGTLYLSEYDGSDSSIIFKVDTENKEN